MTTATQAPSTEHVIMAMLTENTGTNFLDSGGAYGRNWERNQGMTLDSLKAGPDAYYAGYEGVILDLFHYLSERLEYDADEDARFQAFAAENPEDYRLENAEAFATERHEGDQYNPIRVVNSYNHDNCLSQDIQWIEYVPPTDDEYAFEDDRHVLLQIHGGCDARGGYTEPRAFRVTSDAGIDYGMDEFDLYCPGHEDRDQIALAGLDNLPTTQHGVTVNSYGTTDYDGSSSDPWDERGLKQWVQEDPDAGIARGPYYIRCPWCAVQGIESKMEPSAPYVS